MIFVNFHDIYFFFSFKYKRSRRPIAEDQGGILSWENSEGNDGTTTFPNL